MQFTDKNLCTTRSAQDEVLKNESSGSQILAPNNSTQSAGRTLFDDLPIDCKQAEKTDEISFEPQAFRADMQYEREHNENCDNGVYREQANQIEMAARAGLKRPEAISMKE